MYKLFAFFAQMRFTDQFESEASSKVPEQAATYAPGVSSSPDPIRPLGLPANDDATGATHLP
jgi:hypothetical protein